MVSRLLSVLFAFGAVAVAQVPVPQPSQCGGAWEVGPNRGCGNWPQICLPRDGMSVSVDACRRPGMSRSACEHACVQDSNCVGYEHNPGSGEFCVLWQGHCDYSHVSTSYSQYALCPRSGNGGGDPYFSGFN